MGVQTKEGIVSPNGSKFFAMKILKKSEILRLKQVAHIKSEVTLLAKLDHPFIVNMVNHFQDDLKLYMVLEYVPGVELFSYLRAEGRLGNDAARFYSSQIVLAFGYLHEKMIAYRDLKPENLLITANGYLKIADFGFAKVIDNRTWTLCGTPEYLAPEIIQSKGHGRPVDWWAFGVLCFEMLAGYPPFYDENPFGIYQKILAGVVEYPRNFDPKATGLIKKLLTADLTKRIGCLKNGIADIQKHKWYAKTNWKAVLECTITSVPFMPQLLGDGDASNFDEYPESPPGSCIPIADSEKALFEEFDHIGFQSAPQPVVIPEEEG